MSRTYGTISTTLWGSDKFRQLRGNPEAQALYLYLHTCPHVTSIGAFRAPIGYLAADLGWPDTSIHTGIEALSIANLVRFDSEHEVFQIVNYLRFSPICNKKHGAGAVKLAMALPDCEIKASVINELRENPMCSGALPKTVVSTPVTPTPDTCIHTPFGPVRDQSVIPEPDPLRLSLPSSDDKSSSVGNSLKPAALRREFEEEFWPKCAKKVGKAAAARAFAKARRSASCEAICAGMARYAAECATKDREFVAHPATWLNAGRWDDEPEVRALDPLAKAVQDATAREAEATRRTAENGGGEGDFRGDPGPNVLDFRPSQRREN